MTEEHSENYMTGYQTGYYDGLRRNRPEILLRDTARDDWERGYQEGYRQGKKHTWLSEAEERIGQYHSQRKAQEVARRRLQETGRKHHVVLATTWRDLEPRACWSIGLSPK
jgi:hypothetical protein